MAWAVVTIRAARFSQDPLSKSGIQFHAFAFFYCRPAGTAGHEKRFDMKRLFALVVLLFVSEALFAQRNVTRFLGIPVDGTKSEMIRQLKEKGFVYKSSNDVLKGEFNGQDVYVSVVTNNNKVYRIMVRDVYTKNETDIKIRFNKLCNQFANNKKYIPITDEDYTLPESEKISHEILVNKKRYEAAYFQKSGPEDFNYYNKIVWFMIYDESYGKYRILMFYDNKYNAADGDDL